MWPGYSPLSLPATQSPRDPGFRVISVGHMRYPVSGLLNVGGDNRNNGYPDEHAMRLGDDDPGLHGAGLRRGRGRGIRAPGCGGPRGRANQTRPGAHPRHLHELPRGTRDQVSVLRQWRDHYAGRARDHQPPRRRESHASGLYALEPRRSRSDTHRDRSPFRHRGDSVGEA